MAAKKKTAAKAKPKPKKDEQAAPETDEQSAPEAAETEETPEVNPHAPGVPMTLRYRCVEPAGCTIVANWPGGSQRQLHLKKGDTLDVPTAVGRWLDALGWKKAAKNAKKPKPGHH